MLPSLGTERTQAQCRTVYQKCHPDWSVTMPLVQSQSPTLAENFKNRSHVLGAVISSGPCHPHVRPRSIKTHGRNQND